MAKSIRRKTQLFANVVEQRMRLKVNVCYSNFLFCSCHLGFLLPVNERQILWMARRTKYTSETIWFQWNYHINRKISGLVFISWCSGSWSLITGARAQQKKNYSWFCLNIKCFDCLSIIRFLSNIVLMLHNVQNVFVRFYFLLEVESVFDSINFG